MICHRTLLYRNKWLVILFIESTKYVRHVYVCMGVYIHVCVCIISCVCVYVYIACVCVRCVSLRVVNLGANSPTTSTCSQGDQMNSKCPSVVYIVPKKLLRE